MDEAAATLDVVKPGVAVTYAEAGGWGRALALEARRRGVPLAGLQHGFIYRHWLNYRHEPDEMRSPFDGSPDAGFPLPTRTLVFDDYAAEHLARAGCFPREALAVTGSPRLDAMAVEASRLTSDDIERARREAGADGDQPLVLVVSKYTEIRQHLRPLLDALKSLDQVCGAIKTHPAETPALYEAAGAAARNIRVLPPAAPLAPLLRGAAAVVTVNSTVAIDSLVLGTPALSIGLPNNLSPFVQAGAMAGASSEEEIEPALRRVLYDQGFRQQLGTAAAATAARYRIAPDGGAAERSATAILELIGAPKKDQ
jgi:UDP-N-acetylglucosamine 2-epimerase